MITREDIDWFFPNIICFLCRKNLKDIKCIALIETMNNKALPFDQNCFKSIRVCLPCWEQIAGEEWMFSE